MARNSPNSLECDMDPDANLIEQRAVTRDIMKIWDVCPEDGNFTAEQETELVHHAYRLAELVQALDEWIRSGGFLPAGWQKGWIRDRSLDPHPITKGRS